MSDSTQQRAGERVYGVEVRGSHPRELWLSDGSRLILGQRPGDGFSRWRRLNCSTSPESVSVSTALELAGPKFRRYVVTRTRAESAWMRSVADWYRDEAERLGGELESDRSDVEANVSG